MDSEGFDQLLWRAASVGDVRTAAIAQKSLGREPIYSVRHTVRIEGVLVGEERGRRMMLTEAEGKQIAAMSRREAIDETFAVYEAGRLRSEFEEDYPGDSERTLKLTAAEAKRITELGEVAAREALCEIVRSSRFTVGDLLSAFSVDSRREDELPAPPPPPEYMVAIPDDYESIPEEEEHYYDPETPVDYEPDDGGPIIDAPRADEDISPREFWSVVERFHAADDAAANEYLEKHYADRSGDYHVLDENWRDINDPADVPPPREYDERGRSLGQSEQADGESEGAS